MGFVPGAPSAASTASSPPSAADESGFAAVLDDATAAPEPENNHPSARTTRTDEAGRDPGASTASPEATNSEQPSDSIGTTPLLDRPAGAAGDDDTTGPAPEATSGGACDQLTAEAMMAVLLLQQLPQEQRLDPSLGVGIISAATDASGAGETLTAVPVLRASVEVGAGMSANTPNVSPGIEPSPLPPALPQPAEATPAAAVDVVEITARGDDQTVRSAADAVLATSDAGQPAKEPQALVDAMPAADGSSSQQRTASPRPAAPSLDLSEDVDAIAVTGRQADATFEAKPGLTDVPADAVPAVPASVGQHGDDRTSDLVTAAERGVRAVTQDSSPVAEPSAAATASATRVNARALDSLPLAPQIASTVHSAVLRGEHEVRLLLNPPELGRLDIRITHTADGLLIRLDATQSSTRELLDRQMPGLQQALEARDLRVERIQIGSRGDSDGTSMQGRSQGWGQGGQQGRGQQERDAQGDVPAWSPVAALERRGTDVRTAGGSGVVTDRAPRVIRHAGTLDRVA